MFGAPHTSEFPELFEHCSVLMHPSSHNPNQKNAQIWIMGGGGVSIYIYIYIIIYIYCLCKIPMLGYTDKEFSPLLEGLRVAM